MDLEGGRMMLALQSIGTELSRVITKCRGERGGSTSGAIVVVGERG